MKTIPPATAGVDSTLSSVFWLHCFQVVTYSGGATIPGVAKNLSTPPRAHAKYTTLDISN